MSIIHPRNLWVRGSNLTGGQPAKLPSFGGYSHETLPTYLPTYLPPLTGVSLLV